jgi:hypothetical protein
MEDQGSGRVRLSEFYKPALDGAWQFQESIGYLRELGTLDESQSDQPRVMLVNYLTSQANCIASSDYYSVCCIDECEDLFAHLEKEIAAPEATPEHIAELISKLPSSSVSAPRALSATLRTRLNDIAASHGGKVQLHGRLFAQWMHHAYPRECAFPHMSGTTSQQKPEAWTEGSGLHSVATEEELAQFTSSSTATQLEEVDDVHDLMMWSHEEELLIVKAAAPGSMMGGSSLSLASGGRGAVLFAAIVSMVYGVLRSSGKSASAGDASQKFMV